MSSINSRRASALAHDWRGGVGPMSRPDYAASESGTTDYAEHKRLMREWYGLLPMPAAGWHASADCAHWLIGKRCPTAPLQCGLIREWMAPNGPWDHARAWRSEDGDRVITLEPWGSPIVDAPALERMMSALRGIDVYSCFEGRSPYGASYVLFLASDKTPLGEEFAFFEHRGVRLGDRRARKFADHRD
ncbi:MAG: hypothetical protein WAV90_09710 [Gordonia amarae]